MKRLLFLLIFFGGIFLSLPAFATEQIIYFHDWIKIHNDGMAEIHEQIKYDFGSEKKYGIFRDIPVKYKTKDGGYIIRISDISVSDEKWSPYNFEVSYPNENIRIKIGDPDQLISDQHTYNIKYTVTRAINYFNDYDEFYWNVTGNDWAVPILKASTYIVAPEAMNAKDLLKYDCFAGHIDSTIKCLSAELDQNQTHAVYFQHNNLSARQGLTVVIGMPKGVITKPTVYSLIDGIDSAKGAAIIVPVVTFIFCFYLWYTRGRDPKGRGVIIAQYDSPDNLTPAEAGTIIDGNAQNKDVSSEIIYLATKGYLRIKQVEKQNFISISKDYELEILNNNFSELREFQKIIMEGLSKEAKGPVVKLSDLKNKFYKDLNKVKDAIYRSVAEREYFFANPKKVRAIFITLGIGIIIFDGIFSGKLWDDVFGFIDINLIISGAILIIFGYFMPARTGKGVAAKEHILGLKLYMSVAEQRRLEFHNAPEKKPEVFEKLLPYAIALGVEKQWAAQFEGMYLGRPQWYMGSIDTQFNALILANSLSGFSNVANAALSSAASGGSGFSGGGVGGGFGGGGGGSW